MSEAVTLSLVSTKGPPASVQETVKDIAEVCKDPSTLAVAGIAIRPTGYSVRWSGGADRLAFMGALFSAALDLWAADDPPGDPGPSPPAAT